MEKKNNNIFLGKLEIDARPGTSRKAMSTDSQTGNQ